MKTAASDRNSVMGSNASKPYQAQLIRQAGLRTPATLITNDAAEVVSFAKKHEHLVYKSISSVRSIVQTWTAVAGPELERIRNLPTQFQECIPGSDVRVHVVGRRIFATEIATQGIDYRYAAREGHDVAMRAVELPASVADSCRHLASLLDLPFTGIDLKRTPAGAYYCFEANPAPAYSYYQEQTGQQIARALVEYLAGDDPPTGGS
jgi:glutathione synthase/RimK-type ligase-like ATP-grasp enzyme